MSPWILHLKEGRFLEPMIDEKNVPWASSTQEVLESLHVSPEVGLSLAEVKRRQEQYGANQLQETEKKGAAQILVNQFKSLIIALLVVAAGLSFALKDWIEAVAILVVIAINAAIGFFTELKATRSVEALRQLATVASRVRREGVGHEVPAQELVPGDIVIFEGGDIVTADLRLIEASKLQADESTLTGESLPVSKRTEPLGEDVALAERANSLFKGTAVTRGSGEGVVVAIGMGTELGRISSLVEAAKEEITPLEERLNQLGRKLVWVTLGIAALIATMGILAGKKTYLMIETSVALAVAAIPEGLPIVATLVLARGVWRMARRNALINRLSAVETLGATSVICMDKTGTLTENRLTVAQIALDSGLVEVRPSSSDDAEAFSRDHRPIDPANEGLLRQALTIAALCNNASLRTGTAGSSGHSVGDPLEVALLAAAARGGFHRKQLLETMPEVREEAFDSDTKMMATFHRKNDRYFVAVKGAPERVLDASSSVLTHEGERALDEEGRRQWLERNRQMAADGLRVLALATKTVDSFEGDPYEKLSFVGLMGLLDPPRRDVAEAIRQCRGAGVRLIMITGDQPITASNIASAVGLTDSADEAVIHGREIKPLADMTLEEHRRLLRASIFARVTPEQKLDLIDLHQNSGSVVAMTGDGVNDAPALKKADIGIAMGQRGTQVAREAADMVLKDDAFATIVAALHQGRVIFDNIRRFVFYLISCNVSEVLSVSLAAVGSAPLPILPLQILFINLVTDVFPALALGAGEGSPAVMDHPPRPSKEAILTRSHWLAIAGYGAAITASVLGSLALALTCLKVGRQQAVTISFLTLAFAQLWHVFNMRDADTTLFRNEVVRNRLVWGALAACTGLLLAAVYTPTLATVLKLKNPGWAGWTVVIGMSLLPCVLGQLVKSIRRPRLAQ